MAGGLREVLSDGSYLAGLHVPGSEGLAPYRAAARELGGTTITTIHGFMRAGLKLNAPLLGFDPNFTMLAEWEAAALFEEELASVRLLATDPDHDLHHALVIAGEDVVPLAMELFGKRSLAEDLAFPTEPLSTALGLLFQEARNRLLRRLGGGAMGPGEVERAALRLFRTPTTRRRLAKRFPVVLVDEYQDVNPLQGRFFELLAEAGVRLEVVGDPKQSIYGFRSADVGVFRRALDAAEGTDALLEPLKESRRHSRALVAFLNGLTTSLAADGLGFQPREAPLVSAAGDQAKVAGSVRLLVAHGDVNHGAMRQFEADMLATALEAAHEEQGVAYDGMAVVARTNWLLGLVERALQARSIPSLMLRGSGLFDRQEVRDVRHALQVDEAERRVRAPEERREARAGGLYADLQGVPDVANLLAVE
ncbi:MAG TPA: ATP-dependent helicase [Trueperaceae bacterium]|nr:ATP-dependent helicase [Trueperaceae bacterium]